MLWRNVRKSWIQTTAPAVEPLTLAEAKKFIRATSDQEDSLITDFITAAREVAEKDSNRQFITATFTLLADSFPRDAIVLPFGNLQTLDTFTHLDLDGVAQTVPAATYTVDTSPLRGRITLAFNESWPTARAIENSITIVFKAGYGDAATDVPEVVKQAMRYLVAAWHEERLPDGKPDEFMTRYEHLVSAFFIPTVA